jgi:hypothetical protein
MRQGPEPLTLQPDQQQMSLAWMGLTGGQWVDDQLCHRTFAASGRQKHGRSHEQCAEG